MPGLDDSKRPFGESPVANSEIPPLPDLPPVEAPSAGFVVQLFVIPAVVVAVVILVWLLFGKLAGGERDPAEYVRRMRQGSGDWRSAFELASLIQNDSRLASDPRLLGELSDLLASELKHTGDPKLSVYLIKTIGAFQTLDATLADNRKIDPLEPLIQALEPTHDLSIRMEAAASLARQSARLEGKLDDPRITPALAQAAGATEQELRQVAVYSLGFVKGNEATTALRQRLESDENRYVRYNAAVALGRRGDPAARATLKEMLSTSDLQQAIDLPSATEKQNKIEAIELEALQALESSLAHDSGALARSLRADVEELTHSGLVSIRSQAQAVLQKLHPAP
ncbi:MAG: HEAT repeat domain-containing protein [Isosphaeraceae bacterium]